MRCEIIVFPSLLTVEFVFTELEKRIDLNF